MWSDHLRFPAEMWTRFYLFMDFYFLRGYISLQSIRETCVEKIRVFQAGAYVMAKHVRSKPHRSPLHNIIHM